jgi:hypothetical protein
MKTALIVVIGLILGAAIFAFFPSFGDGTLIAKAKQSIEASLFDPHSAQYDDLKIVDTGRAGKLVCGMVNAKNRMGGYVGRKGFIYFAASDVSHVINDYWDTYVQAKDDAFVRDQLLRCFPGLFPK